MVNNPIYDTLINANIIEFDDEERSYRPSTRTPIQKQNIINAPKIRLEELEHEELGENRGNATKGIIYSSKVSYDESVYVIGGKTAVPKKFEMPSFDNEEEVLAWKLDQDINENKDSDGNQEQEISDEEKTQAEMAKENLDAIESLKKLNESLNLQEKELSEKIKERNAQIERLEKVKDKLQNEAEELQKNSRQLSNEMLENANKEAKDIIEKANEEAEKIIEESKKKGFDEGFSKANQEWKSLIEDAKKDIENAHDYKQGVIDNLEQEIIDTILSCVNKILKSKINKDDEAITGLIIETISGLNSREKLIVKISSEDFETTSKIRNKILATFPGVDDVEIKIMDSFISGDLEVESESGVVNPSIKDQFKRLQNEFLDLVPDKEEK